MKASIICNGICRKAKPASELSKTKGPFYNVCKECRKEITRRGLIKCEEGACVGFKELSEFAEPGICKECKDMLENWFDYYCDKDHCRELDIKESMMLLQQLARDGLHSDGSQGNDVQTVVLIRHLMIFILYRMHFKGNPMGVVGEFSGSTDFAEICRDVAEHWDRLWSQKGENVARTESQWELRKAAEAEEMNVKPRNRCSCGKSDCGKTENLELVFKKSWKQRKESEPLCECFGKRKGCTFTSVVFPNSERLYKRDEGSLYDREGDIGRPPCRSCNAAYGQVHHVNCYVEKCPRCNEQILTCECNSYVGHIFRNDKENEYTRHRDFYDQMVLKK